MLKKKLRFPLVITFVFLFFTLHSQSSIVPTYTIQAKFLKDSTIMDFFPSMDGVYTSLNDEFAKVIPDTLTIRYSATGNYIEIRSGVASDTSESKTQYVNIYRNDSKILYQFSTTNENIIGTDVTTENEKLDTIYLLPNIEIIDELACKCVIAKWPTQEIKYYFSDTIMNINPEVFKGYKLNAWYEYLNISKSLPIRIENNMLGQFMIIYNLCEYSEIDYGDQEGKMFDLPPMKQVSNKPPIYKNNLVFEYLD